MPAVCVCLSLKRFDDYENKLCERLRLDGTRALAACATTLSRHTRRSVHSVFCARQLQARDRKQARTCSAKCKVLLFTQESAQRTHRVHAHTIYSRIYALYKSLPDRMHNYKCTHMRTVGARASKHSRVGRVPDQSPGYL